MTYDFIILGAGASGLMLAYRMAQDPFFNHKSVLIIDKSKDKGNDRTWCFWESGSGEWDHIVTKTWDAVYFGSPDYSENISIAPYRYKMIRSASYYSTLWQKIQTSKNITFLQDTVQDYRACDGGVKVVTEHGSYKTLKLINSVPNAKLLHAQNQYPLLQQHFLGWFVQTKTAVFDDNVATFMDFKVPQQGNTRFMYVLPINKTTALFEYTLFSKTLLKKADYETAIKAYLKNKGITTFQIIEKEQGSIPMTAFKFHEQNTVNMIHIGTAGGWTKASTGYTFKNTAKKTSQLLTFLKTNNDLSKFHKISKFWFYDLLFIDVLMQHNQAGAKLFSAMFKKADIRTIFKFLDEESSLWQDLKIIRAVPPRHFIQAFFKRLI